MGWDVIFGSWVLLESESGIFLALNSVPWFLCLVTTMQTLTPPLQNDSTTVQHWSPTIWQQWSKGPIPIASLTDPYLCATSYWVSALQIGASEVRTWKSLPTSNDVTYLTRGKRLPNTNFSKVHSVEILLILIILIIWRYNKWCTYCSHHSVSQSGWSHDSSCSDVLQRPLLLNTLFNLTIQFVKFSQWVRNMQFIF